MIFKVIVEKDESGYYVGEVPALPGCFSQGKNIEELKENITEAIEGWLEVKLVKHPRITEQEVNIKYNLYKKIFNGDLL